MVVSGGQQRDSAIHIHVSILLQTLLPSRLPHNIEQSSVCCTAGPSWFSGASLTAQLVKNLPAVRDTPVDSWVRKIRWRRDGLPTPVFLGYVCYVANVSFTNKPARLSSHYYFLNLTSSPWICLSFCSLTSSFFEGLLNIVLKLLVSLNVLLCLHPWVLVMILGWQSSSLRASKAWCLLPLRGEPGSCPLTWGGSFQDPLSEGAELWSRLHVFGWANPQQAQSFPTFHILSYFSSVLTCGDTYFWISYAFLVFYFVSIIDEESVKVGADRTTLSRDQQLCSSRISSILLAVLLRL